MLLAGCSGGAAVPVQDGYAQPFTADLGQGLQIAAPGRLAGRLLGGPAVSAVTEACGSMAAFQLNGDPRHLWAGDRAIMAALASGQAPASSPAGHVRLALAGGQVIAAGPSGPGVVTNGAGALSGDAASLSLSRTGEAGDALSSAVTRPLALA